jgi:muramoyltetrapeptide carboxypeptidase
MIAKADAEAVLAASDASAVRKPRALRPGSLIMPIAPASPASPAKVELGLRELRRLGLQVRPSAAHGALEFFAGTTEERRTEFLEALARVDVEALVGVRGGYGSNYLLDGLELKEFAQAKLLLGYSDLTSLQIFLWQNYRWVSFYGPMIAAGLDGGAGAAKGYHQESLVSALFAKSSTWSIGLQGEALVPGEAQGRILGGCMTLVETTLGTPWELDTRDAIVLLEDRGMKPWQVDRALMHLSQAGKFRAARGFVLGDFPECEPPVAGSPTVREVCKRILSPLGVPVVFGAPLGHTMRAMLTVPLGVRGSLTSKGEGMLEILEPTVTA